MPSALVNTTVQAAVLSATSNILAQAITAYRENKPLSIDVIPIFHFVLFTILNCPPNVLWQEFLEHTFPGKTTPPMNPNEKAAANGKSSGPREPTLNIANTAKKFALDQTLGAAVNTILFIAVMAGLRGSSGPEIMDAIRQRYWPMTLAGWKLWPAVSLLCFTVVPVQRRVIVGGLVGVGWGIYLSLMAAG